MLFGSKTPLYTSVEIIDTILSDGTLLNKQGSVVIKRKDKRKTVQTGIIYFRGSDVYAASVSDKPIPIAQRVITGGMTDEDSVRRIAKLAGGGHSPDVVRQVLVSNLITESLMDEYVKEHFLENVAEILSWDNCVGEWVRDGKTKDFTMPNVPFTKLKAIILSREVKKNEFAKELSRFFKPEEFEDICPVNKVKNDSSFANEIQALLENSNGENTFEEIAEITGIGKTIVIQTFHKLWIKGIVSLKLQAIELTYDAAQKANKKKDEAEEKEVIHTETLDLHEAIAEQPSEEEESTMSTPDIIDESLKGAEEIAQTEVSSPESYENEVFDTNSEYDEDDSALINGEASIIEVIKKANATEFDIPKEYEVIESNDNLIAPSTLEDNDVAQSEDDLNTKMKHIYEHYGFESKDEAMRKTEDNHDHLEDSEENESPKERNEFDITDFDEVIAEFESLTDNEKENDSEYIQDEVANHDIDQLDTEVDESSPAEENSLDQISTIEDNVEVDSTDNVEEPNEEELNEEELNEEEPNEEEPNEEEPNEEEPNEEEPNEEEPNEEEPNEEEEVAPENESENENSIEEDTDESFDELIDESFDEPIENESREDSSLENIELPQEIQKLDLATVEVNTLSELMSRLSELQEADSLIDNEIKKQENMEDEQLINDTYDAYVDYDAKIQNEEQEAREILDSYNVKVQEIEKLSIELESIREKYELLQNESAQRTVLINQLQLKKEEVAQVIRQVTLQFSSKS